VLGSVSDADNSLMLVIETLATITDGDIINRDRSPEPEVNIDQSEQVPFDTTPLTDKYEKTRRCTPLMIPIEVTLFSTDCSFAVHFMSSDRLGGGVGSRLGLGVGLTLGFAVGLLVLTSVEGAADGLREGTDVLGSDDGLDEVGVLLLGSRVGIRVGAGLG